MTQAVDSVTGTITRGYDGLDRLTSETTPQGSVTYTYDSAGRRQTMTVAVYFYRARYYNPTLQRFISEDTIRYRGGINLYAYARNLPTEFIDPSGNAPCKIKCAATVADEVSIAGYFDLGDNPLVKGVLGNTWSGIYDTVQHFDQDPVKFAGDLALGGLGQGLVPGGGLLGGGVLGAGQDLALNTLQAGITGEGSDILELNLSSAAPGVGTSVSNLANEAGFTDLGTAGAEVAETGLAGVVAVAKLTWDSYAFAYGLWRCW